MSMSTKTRRISYVGAALAAAVTVGAMTMSSPAKADWAGVQIGPFGFGVGAPGPYYGYPYYPDYYYYPPYRPYYPY